MSEEGLTTAQCLALSLWREGMGFEKADVRAFSSAALDELWEVFRIGQKHALLSLMYEPLERVYSVLEGGEDGASRISDAGTLPAIDTILNQISAIEKTRVLSTYHLWYEAMRICDVLKEKGIAPVLLKGPAVGCYYAVPEVRKSGDIDIYLPYAARKRHGAFGDFGKEFEKAAEVLENLGYHRTKDTSHPHHVGFLSAEGLEVELHGRLCMPFCEDAVNETVDLFADEIEDGVLWDETFCLLDRYHFPVLLEAENIYYNILHTLSHFTIGGCGWKFLCDFAMMFREKKSDEVQKRLYALLERSRLLDFAEALAEVCVQYLGLPGENVEFLISGEVSEETCRSLVAEFFAAGEFGDGDESRMVRLEGSGIWALVREFHHQMKINYPRASRWILLWPLLWGMTLARFLWNNKKVRGVSARSVIQNARERGKATAGLVLFRR